MSLVVDTVELGPIGTNCHLVRASRESAEALVVDPSGAAAEIRLRLASAGARCSAIALTHCHWDHFLGLAELAEGTEAPVWLPAEEEAVFRAPSDVYQGLGIVVPAFTGEATLVRGGDIVEAAGIALEVVDVPGHSPGHVAFHADGHLFSGDVLFAGGVGRVDLPGGSWSVLQDSIATLLERFPPDTVVHPGHGQDTTLGRELATNPFLGELRAARAAAD